MRRDNRVDSAAELAEHSMCPRFILAHQPAETDYIRVQNGGEFPLPKAGLKDYGHRPSNDEPNIEGSAHRHCV
jgi:hypothetical protein